MYWVDFLTPFDSYRKTYTVLITGTWYGERCRFCYVPPDDDDFWGNRALKEEGQTPAQRFLADPESSDWSEVFHKCLVDGPFEYFHSIEDVTFTLDGTPLMHGSLHN